MRTTQFDAQCTVVVSGAEMSVVAIPRFRIAEQTSKERTHMQRNATVRCHV